MSALLLIEFICCTILFHVAFVQSSHVECILRSLQLKTTENIPIIISVIARHESNQIDEYDNWNRKSDIFVIVQTIKTSVELITNHSCWNQIDHQLQHRWKFYLCFNYLSARQLNISVLSPLQVQNYQKQFISRPNNSKSPNYNWNVTEKCYAEQCLGDNENYSNFSYLFLICMHENWVNIESPAVL